MVRRACPAKQRAFTLVELVMVMILIGILATVAIPRFADKNAFAAAGFGNQLTASLKSAVAMRRNVCVELSRCRVDKRSASTIGFRWMRCAYPPYPFERIPRSIDR